MVEPNPLHRAYPLHVAAIRNLLLHHAKAQRAIEGQRSGLISPRFELESGGSLRQQPVNEGQQEREIQTGAAIFRDHAGCIDVPGRHASLRRELFAQFGTANPSHRSIGREEEEDAFLLEPGQPSGLVFLTGLEMAPESLIAAVHRLGEQIDTLDLVIAAFDKPWRSAAAREGPR